MMTPARRRQPPQQAGSFSPSTTEDDDFRSIAESSISSPVRSSPGGTVKRRNRNNKKATATWNPFSPQLREQRRLLLQQTPERKKSSTQFLLFARDGQYPMKGDDSTTSVINPYRMLQIRKDATQHEIRQAYRRVALWHHPQRQSCVINNDLESERRQGMFLILAACCETLLERESRSRLDALLRGGGGGSARQPLSSSQQQQQQTQTASTPGNGHGDSPKRSTTLYEPTTGATAISLPALSHSFSSYYEDHDDDSTQRGGGEAWGLCACGDTPVTGACSFETTTNHKQQQQQQRSRRNRRRSLTSCSTEEMDNIQYTKTETDRLFGGPLSLMYRARLFQPFSDPHKIFDRIFGCSLFPPTSPSKRSSSDSHKRFATPVKQTLGDKDNNAFTKEQDNTPSAALQTTANGLLLAGTSAVTKSPLRPSSAWTGSHEVLPDGSKVYSTCRIFHHRKLIKREHITVDPVTGQKHSSITVTSEDVSDDDETMGRFGKSKKGHQKQQLAETTDFDPGYWSCCGPMFSLGGKKKVGISHDNMDGTSDAPGSPRAKPNGLSPATSIDMPPTPDRSSPRQDSRTSPNTTKTTASMDENIMPAPSSSYLGSINCVCW